MAFVVRRPQGRWEIRESFATDRGPRARTLVTFKTLSPQVIKRAVRAAKRPLDPGELVRAARRAGVPVALTEGESLAQSLLRHITHGGAVRPGLRRLLLDRLSGEPAPSVDGSVAEWIGASPEERGAALVDLLGLVDRLPVRRPAPLRFPRLSPTRSRG